VLSVPPPVPGPAAPGPDLLGVLRTTDATSGLFTPGDTVVVAVSGGADSVALLHLLRAYAPERALSLHVAHLDHMLRPASADDAAAVAGLAAAWDLPATLAARDVQAFANERGRGLEDAARTVRYAFLARVAADIGATAVATAHTADDQAETVLMNVLRGTGLTGLRGMGAVSGYPVAAADIRTLEDVGPTMAGWPPRLVRPLLGVARADIEAWLSAHGLKAREDATNRDRRFLRNRIRLDVRPLLETINPRLTEALVRMAAGVGEDLDLIEAALDSVWPSLAQVSDDSVTMDLAAWRDLAPTLRRRALRRAAAHLGADGRAFGWPAVEAAYGLADGVPAGARMSLPGRLSLQRADSSFTLLRSGADIPPLGLGPAARRLSVPGTTVLPGGWAIHAELRPRQPGGAVLGRWQGLFDADSVGAMLAVRGRQPGDRFAPLGLGGHQKTVQDLFVDSHVPRAERDGWPLVVVGDAIVWVVGVRFAETARLTSQAHRLVALTVEPPTRLAGLVGD
jgi:tRNA(Ile)-lysidine synthetase-like protein